jgi:hypothetical protein
VRDRRVHGREPARFIIGGPLSGVLLTMDGFAAWKGLAVAVPDRRSCLDCLLAFALLVAWRRNWAGAGDIGLSARRGSAVDRGRALPQGGATAERTRLLERHLTDLRLYATRHRLYTRSAPAATECACGLPQDRAIDGLLRISTTVTFRCRRCHISSRSARDDLVGVFRATRKRRAQSGTRYSRCCLRSQGSRSGRLSSFDVVVSDRDHRCHHRAWE